MKVKKQLKSGRRKIIFAKDSRGDDISLSGARSQRGYRPGRGRQAVLGRSDVKDGVGCAKVFISKAITLLPRKAFGQ